MEPRRGDRETTVESASTERAKPTWRNWLACAILVVLIGTVYLVTLYPGVGKGDSAELQYMCPLLGVCHPPGYALEVVVGKLFSWLPIGPSVAWRINLMQAVCGVIGCLALYGALRRLTGQILPAAIACATLAFSAIYWQACVRAEVYAFYGMFLLLGIYAVVRFLQSDKGAWFFLAALLLGICVGGRLSELLVLPAIGGLWWGYRQSVRLTPGRVIVALGLAVLPFVLTVCFHLVRDNPRYLHARDDALRDELLGKYVSAERSFPQRVGDAIAYSIGLKAAGRAEFTKFSLPHFAWDLNKYAWHLSGLGALGERRLEHVEGKDGILYRARGQGRGTGVGVLGVLLALVGLWRWRRVPGVIMLGAGLFLGNLVYYVSMHPVDNLHFTVPGQAGIAVCIAFGLARLPGGCAGRPSPRAWFRGYQIAGLLVPLFLLVTNYRPVDPREASVREHQDLAELVKVTPLPARAAILATYSRAHTLRYIYWIEAKRPEVPILIFGEWLQGEDARNLLLGLEGRGYELLISTDAIQKDSMRHQWAEHTPRELVDVGLFCTPTLRRGGERSGPRVP